MMSNMNLQFLVFLVEVAYPRYNAYCFIIYMVINYWDILKQQRQYRIEAVSSKFLKTVIGNNTGWDINKTVVVNGNTKLKNSIKYAIVAESNNILRRKVNVITRHMKRDTTALLTYNLSYNLNEAKTCSFRKCQEKTLKYAHEVELSLINSSCEWNNFFVDTCLKNYFKIPKLLHNGDIVTINLKEFGKEIFYFANKVINIDENLYFKCNKVIHAARNVEGSYLCAIDKSTLKQTTNIQSFIPKRIDGKNITVGLKPLYPGTFDTYVEKINKATRPFTIKSKQNFLPVFLIEGRKGSGKSLLVQSIASHMGMHLHTVNNFDVSANVYAQNESKLRNIFFNAKMVAPSILEFKNFENFGKNNEGEYDDRLINHFENEVKSLFKGTTHPVIVFCSSNEKNIPTSLKRVFLKIFEIQAPTDQQREQILWWILNVNNVKTNVDLKNLASKTHGFLFEDLSTLTHYATTEFYKQYSSADDDNIPDKNFFQALDFMQSNYNESLGAPKIPQVKWSDVGGLTDVKEEIIKTIKLPLKHPNLLKTSGLKRSGILLFGPPGTGKTLLAKAVATECGLCFLSIKGPELLNMYVGQSEQNVREVFQRGRDASPCIIFFDELDSLAPNRGSSGDSGGVMDRVVSQLLAEMDGLNQAATIFIIGATNRPDLIDPALLRPGRFDKLLYVGPCIDQDSKIAVLRALTRKFHLEKESIIEEVINFCPENFSGADFYGVCSGAWMSAVRRLLTHSDNGNEKNGNLTSKDIVVTAADFEFAIKNIKPSIKQKDLDYFNKLKSEYK